MIRIKRVYEIPAKDDGFRVLVDRLWPRGVSKERAALDQWLKNIAPSQELRLWFGHRPEKFAEFTARYIDELHQNPAVEDMRQLHEQHKQITLVYAAEDTKVNHALVLQRYLTGR